MITVLFSSCLIHADAPALFWILVTTLLCPFVCSPVAIQEVQGGLLQDECRALVVIL
jgi:hypothetical protein